MEDQLSLVATRAQQLASSGVFEGFNALVPTLEREFGEVDVDRLRRDATVRNAITDVCQEAWRRALTTP